MYTVVFVYNMHSDLWDIWDTRYVQDMYKICTSLHRAERIGQLQLTLAQDLV